MRRLKIALIIFASALFALPNTSLAQGRFGPDSANCVSFLNFYRDSYNIGNYKDAYPLWTQAMKSCPPKASQNLFIHGKKILMTKIQETASDPARQAIIIDSLLALSETRAQYYPSKALIAIEDKIGSLMYFYGTNVSKSKMIYEYIDSYADRFGVKSDPKQLVNALVKASEAYQNGELEAEKIMVAYTKYNDLIDARAKVNANEDIDEEKQMLQNAFVGSGVANCENLEKVFRPRFDENKGDSTLVKMIAGLLNSNECTDSDFFNEVVAQMHHLNPSASSAYFLYRFFNNKGDADQALHYLKEAAKNAEGTEKGVYTYELSTVYMRNHSYAAAAAAAREAASLNPKYAGKAEMIIGQVWAASNCSGNEMEKRAKFWVATDCMNRAKNLDESLAEEANKNIARYRAYFPKTADAFMFDLTDGKSFTVSCSGMTATTIVRTNK